MYLNLSFSTLRGPRRGPAWLRGVLCTQPKAKFYSKSPPNSLKYVINKINDEPISASQALVPPRVPIVIPEFVELGGTHEFHDIKLDSEVNTFLFQRLTLKHSPFQKSKFKPITMNPPLTFTAFVYEKQRA